VVCRRRRAESRARVWVFNWCWKIRNDQRNQPVQGRSAILGISARGALRTAIHTTKTSSGFSVSKGLKRKPNP
jgi:hypothetical protein